MGAPSDKSQDLRNCPRFWVLDIKAGPATQRRKAGTRDNVLRDIDEQMGQ